MIKTIFNRIRLDYFLRNRINEYEHFIKTALDKGFEIMPHSQFYDLVKKNEIGSRKIVMIRQDIDQDPNYCREWLRVEKKYKIHTSYYFRLCTKHIPIMKEILAYGSDCGYHYEELATYAKRNHIKSATVLMDHFDAIRKEFSNNLQHLEAELGQKIQYIASHGDFANRKLKMPNHTFINREVLDDNGLIFEAYDKEFLENYSINIMDAGGPKFYNGPVSQLDALDQYQIVHILIHPKNWKANVYWNTYENCKRFIQGLKY
jgi:hypothetical protein